MADTKLIAEAWAILGDATPLDFDCGTLCGQKCCTDFLPDVGVYLLPGELPLYDGSEDWAAWQFHSPQEYEFAPSWAHHAHIPFMRCQMLCRREKRPLACRIYPLTPCLSSDGTVDVAFDPFAEGVCPILERFRIDQLRPDFVAAVKKAWTVLCQDPEFLDYVRWVTEQVRAWQELPHLDPEEEEAR
ncbi:MAG: hypothetical protein ACM3XM_00375 [Mycobacterium leprae]